LSNLDVSISTSQKIKRKKKKKSKNQTVGGRPYGKIQQKRKEKKVRCPALTNLFKSAFLIPPPQPLLPLSLSLSLSKKIQQNV
jgi:hypothetical protein